MKRFGVLALALSLGACVTSRPVSLPDGSSGYSIRCDGHSHDIADCMNEAARLCAGPYQVVGEDGETGGAVAVPVGRTLVMGARRNRNLIVACGK